MSDDKKLLNALLRNDFNAFYRKVFNTISTGDEFADGWYIQALCYHLSMCVSGAIKRLIITIPPRMGKSMCASVALPAFLLGHDPTMRMICASYGQDLATKFLYDMREIIDAPWYRKLFPKTRPAKVGVTQNSYRTSRLGQRLSTSVGGVLHGMGGNFIIVDDAHKADDSQSKRESAIEWFKHSLLTRLDDKENGCIIVIQQRLHEDDLAGHLLKQGGWYHLNLRAIAEEPEAILIAENKMHHRKVGDLLDPIRHPQKVLDGLKASMGSYGFAAQYQQNPAPLDGGIIKKAWLKPFKKRPEYEVDKDLLVQSWDTASSINQSADFSVCTTWLMKSSDYYLIHVLRKRLEYPQLRQAVIDMAYRWSGNKVIADVVLIEKSSSGFPLIQELRQTTSLNIMGVDVNNDKQTRMFNETPAMEAGRVHYDRTATWSEAFIRELLLFPNAKHDDQVDSLSQFLYYARWKRTQQVPQLKAIITPIYSQTYLPDNLFSE